MNIEQQLIPKDEIEEKFSDDKTEVVEMEEKASKMEISSDEDVEIAIDYLSDVKDKKDFLENMREVTIVDVKRHLRKIDKAVFKPMLNTLDDIYDGLRDSIGKYETKKQEKQRKKEEKKEKSDNPIDNVEDESSSGANTYEKKDKGKVSFSEKVEIEVNDVNDLPEKYKKKVLEMANEKGLVKRMVKDEVKNNGLKKMKGVSIDFVYNTRFYNK